MILKQLNMKILITIFLKPCIQLLFLPHFDFMPLQKICSSDQYREFAQETLGWGGINVILQIMGFILQD